MFLRRKVDFLLLCHIFVTQVCLTVIIMSSILFFFADTSRKNHGKKHLRYDSDESEPEWDPDLKEFEDSEL